MVRLPSDRGQEVLVVLLADAAAADIVLEVRVERVMPAVVDLQVSKGSRVHRRERAFLHVWQDVVLNLLLFLRRDFDLILERAFGGVVRNLTHAFAVDAHRLVRLSRHAKELAHLRGRWRVCARLLLRQGGNVTVLITTLLEVRVFQGLCCRHAVVVVVDQQLTDHVTGLRILGHHLDQARALNPREVELHVAGDLLELVQQLLLRRA